MTALASATPQTSDLAIQVAKGIQVVAEVATVESRLMPYAMMIAGLFPGAASVLAAISIAQPYIDKAVAAAPAIEAAVVAGAPIIDAIQTDGPEVLAHIKTAYSIMASATGATVAVEDVSDSIAIKFAGKIFHHEWTQEETQRYWDKATGQW